MIGSRLGAYEITAKLGEGGMGEVYRATDSKLRREVAIKVLPAAFTADRERRARFERGAQLLAQLNHSNIAHVYGLETSGDAHAVICRAIASASSTGSAPCAYSLMRYSPTAQGLAYTSDEAGTAQGFVVSVQQGPSGVQLGSDRQRLPVEGAQMLRWRQDGRELFAVSGDGAPWAVPVDRRDGTLHLGAAEKLFADSFVQGEFDVYDNGRRFLFRVDPAARHQTLGVVLNWPARLARERE